MREYAGGSGVDQERLCGLRIDHVPLPRPISMRAFKPNSRGPLRAGSYDISPNISPARQTTGGGMWPMA